MPDRADVTIIGAGVDKAAFCVTFQDGDRIELGAMVHIIKEHG